MTKDNEKISLRNSKRRGKRSAHFSHSYLLLVVIIYEMKRDILDCQHIVDRLCCLFVTIIGNKAQMLMNPHLPSLQSCPMRVAAHAAGRTAVGAAVRCAVQRPAARYDHEVSEGSGESPGKVGKKSIQKSRRCLRISGILGNLRQSADENCYNVIVQRKREVA